MRTGLCEFVRRILPLSVLVFTSLLPPATVTAQSLRFRHFSVDQGLPSSLVSDLAQDRYGFMWMATGHGVARFDGHRFVVYNAPAGSPGALPRELVDQLSIAPDGTVWAVTEGGISRFRPDRDAFETFRSERLLGASAAGTSPVVTRLLVDSGGRMWLGTSAGLHVVDTTTWKATPVVAAGGAHVSRSSITALLPDRNGGVWVGTRNGLHRVLAGRTAIERAVLSTGAKLTLPTPWVRALAFDKHGRLWIATQGGVAVLDSAEGSVRALRRSDARAAGPSPRVARLWSDRMRDGMWIGTENGGLDYYSIRRDVFEHHEHDAGDPSSLRSNSIWALMQDTTGMLWVGTFSGGVSAALPYGAAIRGYASVATDPTSLSYDAVPGFGEEPNGDIWVATDGGGLNRFQPATGRFERLSSATLGIPVNAILSVARDRAGVLWLGTWGGGVVAVDPTRRRSRVYDKRSAGLTNDNVYEVLVDRHNEVWAGTDDGFVVRIDRTSGRVAERFDVTPRDAQRSSVLVLREIGDGRFAAALRSGGVVLLNVRDGMRHYLRASAPGVGIASDAARALAVQGDSILWIGTEGGLDRYDVRTHTRSHVGVRQGLPSRFVMGVLLDGKGLVWVSSDRGLTRLDPATGATRTFTRNDGLASNEFIMRSAFKAGDGRLYFGGNNGFTIVDPRRLPTVNTGTPVVFTHLSLFDKPVAVGGAGSPLRTWMPAVDTLRLRHDQKMLGISYSALNYGAADRTVYEYRMTGFQEQWQHLGAQSSLSFSTLLPGSYGLQVRAMDDNGAWSVRPGTLTIIVSPPFWATWWFRTLVGLFAVLGTWRFWTFQQTRQVEMALARQALRDPLTGLANRLLFEERVASAVVRAARTNSTDAAAKKHVALLFIDLDNFKTVNDTLGHHAGDALLQVVATRLLDATRGSDTVARFGGDEFAVLLEDVTDHASAQIVANRITDSVKRPIEVGTEARPHAAHVGASIGIAFGDGGQPVPELMRHADIAMYEAKHGGKGRHAIFDPVLRATADETRVLEESLPRALDNGEFTLLYQPVVDIHTGCMVGAEALLRWRHPERGWIAPDRFIPIAEGNGQIARIGAWVMATACEAAAQWPVAPNGEPPFVSVNLSGRQLGHAGLVLDVRHALNASGLEPSRLLLEITETVMMKDSARALQVLQQLRTLGVRFAVDDFGTGYSSLRYLQQFPVDVLKIDRSFVERVVDGEHDQAITSMVVALATSLGLQTIAEGIETEAQRDVLEQLGASWAQGFYFQRPVPAEMIADLVKQPLLAPLEPLVDEYVI